MEFKKILANLRELTLTFLIVALLCIVSLGAVSFIPQSSIKEQVIKSSEYLSEKELFPDLIAGQFNTRIDNYGDCIMVNILYHLNNSKESHWYSLINAGYYQEEYQNVNDGLAESLMVTKEPNVTHAHYWNGLLVILGPLFLVTDLKGVRVVMSVISLIAFVMSLFLLWNKRKKALAVCYLLGMVLINSWIICFCAEYGMMFLLMSIVNLWVIMTWQPGMNLVKRNRTILKLMVLCGVLTAFFDLLTTETLTVTVPLFLELAMEKEEEGYPGNAVYKTNGIHYLLRNGIAWGVSYGMMFLLKWILTAVTIGFPALVKAAEQAKLRVNGIVYLGNTNLSGEASGLERLSGAISRNLTMLLPARGMVRTRIGVVIFIIFLIICLSIVYLYRAENFSIATIGVYAILGLVPYIRFLFISSHAYQHYFFTYRAQLVTIMMILYVTWQFGLKNRFKK